MSAPTARQFTYDALPGRVVFGAGASRRLLAAEVDRLGASRLLLSRTWSGCCAMRSRDAGPTAPHPSPTVPSPPKATESTVFGPFFVEGSPAFSNGGDLANGAPGEPCLMQGRVLNLEGEPVPGAHIEVWMADEDGFYDVQYDGLDEPRGRGHLRADDEGRWWFWSVKPEAYPIPSDGPVGGLLEAAGRHPMRPAHVHFMVEAPPYQRLITHVFADGDRWLDSDAVFGVRSNLITGFERREAGTAPDGRHMQTPYWTMSYDIVLAPGDEDGDELPPAEQVEAAERSEA
jgi:protocatechuate 3,4-dioxygenase beta subunit